MGWRQQNSWWPPTAPWAVLAPLFLSPGCKTRLLKCSKQKITKQKNLHKILLCCKWWPTACQLLGGFCLHGFWGKVVKWTLSAVAEQKRAATKCPQSHWNEVPKSQSLQYQVIGFPHIPWIREWVLPSKTALQTLHGADHQLHCTKELNHYRMHKICKYFMLIKYFHSRVVDWFSNDTTLPTLIFLTNFFLGTNPDSVFRVSKMLAWKA